jgi:hypothetical protein
MVPAQGREGLLMGHLSCDPVGFAIFCNEWKPIFRYRMSRTKSKRAARPSGASAIRIAKSRRNNPSRRFLSIAYLLGRIH